MEVVVCSFGAFTVCVSASVMPAVIYSWEINAESSMDMKASTQCEKLKKENLTGSMRMAAGERE